MNKTLALLLALVLALGLLAGCGSSQSAEPAAAEPAAEAEAPAAEAEAPADEDEAPANDLAGTTIRIAASPTPHAEILAQVVDDLAEQGIDALISYEKDVLGGQLVWKVGRVG